MKLSMRLLAISFVAACLGVGWPAAAAAHAATPAWQPVGATGPTVIPAEQSEVQKLYVDAEGESFTLTARELAAERLGDVTGTSLNNGQSAVENVITTSG